MIGIILVILAARGFYKLAKTYKRKNAWLFGLSGVLMYYAAAILLSTAIFILRDLIFGYAEEEIPFYLQFLSIPVAIGITYAYYKLLENQFKKKQILGDEEIIDQDIVQN